jgi:hypothetical protein
VVLHVLPCAMVHLNHCHIYNNGLVTNNDVLDEEGSHYSTSEMPRITRFAVNFIRLKVLPNSVAFDSRLLILRFFCHVSFFNEFSRNSFSKTHTPQRWQSYHQLK